MDFFTPLLQPKILFLKLALSKLWTNSVISPQVELEVAPSEVLPRLRLHEVYSSQWLLFLKRQTTDPSDPSPKGEACNVCNVQHSHPRKGSIEIWGGQLAVFFVIFW